MEWGSNTIGQANANYAYHMTYRFLYGTTFMTTVSGCVTKLEWISSTVAIRLMCGLHLKSSASNVCAFAICLFPQQFLFTFIWISYLPSLNLKHSFSQLLWLNDLIMIVIRTHFPSTTKLGFVESLAEVYWLLWVNSEVGHSSCLLNWEPLESSQTLHLSSLHFISGDSDQRACIRQA